MSTFFYGGFRNYESVPSHNQHLKRWYIDGANYSETFATWLNNFDSNQESVKQLNYGMDYANFCRIWRFYLMWFVCNFASCDGEYNGNGQFLMAHA